MSRILSAFTMWIAVLLPLSIVLCAANPQDKLDALRRNIPGEPGKDYPIHSFSLVCKLNPKQCGGQASANNGGGKKGGGGNRSNKTNGKNRGSQTSDQASTTQSKSSVHFAPSGISISSSLIFNSVISDSF